MDGYVLARVIHVLAVIHWIGGVAMVTLVILPQMLRLPPAGGSPFRAGRGPLRDAGAGLGGFRRALGRVDAVVTDGWARFGDPAGWVLHLMVAVWAIFALVLFVLDPSSSTAGSTPPPSPTPRARSALSCGCIGCALPCRHWLSPAG